MATDPETPEGDERRPSPRFIVPVPVGSVAPRGPDGAQAASAARGRTPRAAAGPLPPRPDAVAFAVILLWVSAAIALVGLVLLAIATGIAADAARRAGLEAEAVAVGSTALLVVGALVVAVQVLLTVLIGRGSDAARAWLAVVAAVAVVLGLVAGEGGGALGAVVLVVAVAALFVPSSSAWFRDVGRRAPGGVPAGR